jgi:TrmH family RNA methyltransferase
MFACIMVEPKTPGNIGAVARSMANFDITGPLILVDPKHINDEAYMLACGASDILDNAVIVSSYDDALSLVDYAIATSREAGHAYNVRRIPLLPDDLSRAVGLEGTVAIVLGREDSGLTNDEVERSDMLVTIPASGSYPTLNVAHAATIIFYELFKASGTPHAKRESAATREEREMLFEDFDAIVRMIDHRPYRHRSSSLIFRRVVARSFITSREAYTLKGVLRKTARRLRHGAQDI